MWYAWRRLAARPTNEMCAQFIMFAMMYALRERFPDLRLCKKAHIERKQKSRRLRDEDKPWLCLHTLKWLGKLPVAQRGHHRSYNRKEEGDSGIVMLDSLSLYSWLYIIFQFICGICRGHQDDLSAAVMTIPHALGSRSFISWIPAQLQRTSFGRSWMQAIITLFLLPILAAPNVWGMTLGEIRFVSASKLVLYTFCIYFIFARNEKNIEILYNFKPG